jgi:hypothetical protein
MVVVAIVMAITLMVYYVRAILHQSKAAIKFPRLACNPCLRRNAIVAT